MQAVAAIVVCLFFLSAVHAQESTTVFGPSNVPLQDGAAALRAGDAEEGIRLSKIGLSQAGSSRERQAAYSNICAGYVLLGQYEQGLSYCDDALAEHDQHWRALSNRALIYIKLRRFEEADADLLAGEAISPNARTLKAVRKMYLDAIHPVAPSVIVDDRRDPDADSAQDDAE